MVNGLGGGVRGGKGVRVRSDGLGGGVGGYVMVFDGEGLGDEGELERRKWGWGVVLLDMCGDLRGRDGIGVWCCGVKFWSLE